MPAVENPSGSGNGSGTEYHTDKMAPKRLRQEFFTRDVLRVAPDLIGKLLAVRSEDRAVHRYMITETEAYRGGDDKACHASKGRTDRTRVMFDEGGRVYVYFVYGMYWMLNFVAGRNGEPQAALIRGIEGYDGPGKLTRALGIDGSYYSEDLAASDRIWVEDPGLRPEIQTGPRIGISYAGEPWVSKKWRYYLPPKPPEGGL